MQQQERWRAIAGAPGYEVSDLGRVRSLDRVVVRVRHGRPVDVRYRGKVLKPSVTSRGYLNVEIGGRTRSVHRLVLEAFAGPCPAGHQAAHRNGDRRDNRLENLRWSTPKANHADRYRHGTILFGTRNPMGAKVACKRGHPYDEANTRRRVGGGRACYACQLDLQRQRAAVAVGTHRRSNKMAKLAQTKRAGTTAGPSTSAMQRAAYSAAGRVS